MAILDWVLVLAIYFAATWWVSFGIIAPIIVLRVTFPCTLALERVVRIDGDMIRKKSRMTLWLWGIIDIIVIAFVTLIGGSLIKLPVGAAFIITMLSGLKKTGRNLENIHDYFKGNLQFIHEDDRERAAEELVAMSTEISAMRK